MESNPGSPPPLQFDTAQAPSSPSGVAAQGVTCTMCQGTLLDEYFDVTGQPVCTGCRTKLEHMAETPRGWAPFTKAGALGLVAAVLGATLYYAVIAITDFEIGIVAIAIGFMVGWAVRKATDGRGGRRYQVLALVLTYWAVGLAYMPLTFQQLADADTTDQTQASIDAPAPALRSDPTSAESSDEGSPVSPGMAVVVLLGLSFALPVLAVIGSLPGGLISALIIGIGMRQAWQMTGVPKLQISGPYRIAPASSRPAL